jgi:hypothetical protein
MNPIHIKYCFVIDEQKTEILNLAIDSQSLELINNKDQVKPPWTCLDYHQCPHCPLDTQTHPHCPVAVNLIDVVGRFKDICSYQKLFLEVTTQERKVSQHTTAQRAISSLLGLLFATSGCPFTEYMKPMARFHLPLASEQDTIFRASGMYLLAQYFLQKKDQSSEKGLDGLKQIYKDLHMLNVMLTKRIHSTTEGDSSVNAVVILDTFTKLMPFAIEENLNEIEPLFQAYFPHPN